MAPLASGSAAPSIPGVAFDKATLVAFYKVTCPICQMAAPKMQALDEAYPGHLVGIGQDPQLELAAFGSAYGLAIDPFTDAPPYELSEAYGIRTVPTLFLVDDGGTVVDTVESWDRDGYNRVSNELADLTDSSYVQISEAGDGLPPFRPG